MDLPLWQAEAWQLWLEQSQPNDVAEQKVTILQNYRCGNYVPLERLTLPIDSLDAAAYNTIGAALQQRSSALKACISESYSVCRHAVQVLVR
jgi:hypothetical protein